MRVTIEADTSLRILEGHTDDAESVVFSPDGQTLASGSVDEAVRVWRNDDVTLQGFLKTLDSSAHNVSFSNDGVLLAAGGGGKARYRAPVAGRRRRPPAHPGGAQGACVCVAFSPDEKMLASGGDRTVRLWQVSA
jgi:hypothetical protein